MPYILGLALLIYAICSGMWVKIAIALALGTLFSMLVARKAVVNDANAAVDYFGLVGFVAALAIYFWPETSLWVLAGLTLISYI